MHISTLLATPLAAAAFVAVSLAPATAANNGPDNANGQVERGPEHANSICSYSGLNDVPLDPEEGGRVQSFGQVIKAVKAFGLGASDLKAEGSHPGVLCNGHNFPYPEAFEEPSP